MIFTNRISHRKNGAVSIKLARLTDFDVLGLARIIGWEAGHGVGAAVGDPDPILLINGQMEGHIDLEGAVHPPLSIDQFLTNWARRFLAHAVSLCPLSMGRSSP